LGLQAGFEFHQFEMLVLRLTQSFSDGYHCYQSPPQGANVASLLVRGVDERVVRALKKRAGAKGRSAEAEHREILIAALLRPRTKTFAQVLASMPAVGTDADFERSNGSLKETDVFD
jgi:antitoxin FitA